MNKQYHQLTQELGYQISASRKTGMTLRQIAEEVGVHFSTVCRELKRNVTSLNYDPKIAHTLSCKRRRMSKKACKRQPSTDEIIRKCMVLNWSPGAISDRMPIEFAPSECLSHTSIYRRIEENKQQGGTLYQQLPRYGKTRWKGGKRKNNQDTHDYSLLDGLYLLESDCLINSLLYQSSLLLRQTILKYSVMSEISTISLKIRHQKNQTAIW